VKLTVQLGRPYNLALPQITGTAAVGQVLTCENGDWSGNPVAYTHQWTRDGVPIAGATAQKYTLTEADGAALIACVVRASNEIGDGSATAGNVRAAQYGGSDITLDGKTKLTANDDGSYTVDTGITAGCPARLPVPCAGGTRLDTTTPTGAARSAATVRVASKGFAVATGKKEQLVLRIGRTGSRLLKKYGSLKLVAVVTTRNHKLERVTSRKTFTVHA
jgi:hypothetical protein